MELKDGTLSNGLPETMLKNSLKHFIKNDSEREDYVAKKLYHKKYSELNKEEKEDVDAWLNK